MAGTRPKDVIAQVATPFHRSVFTATNGRAMGTVSGMPVVMLTTTGRKSGQRRETMLTSPVHDDERVVLLVSYGGDDRHPAWFLDLQADPDVEITMEGKRRRMRARVATAAEKAKLWDDVVRAYKGYGGYQKRTDRDIPLAILEPAAG